MKKHLLLLAAVLVCACTGSFAQVAWQKSIVAAHEEEKADKPANFYDIQKAFNDYWKDKTPSFDEHDNGMYGGYQQFKRWEWFMEPRVYPTGEFFDSEILYKEYKKEKETQKRLSIHAAVTSANWSFIGPAIVPPGGGCGR